MSHVNGFINPGSKKKRTGKTKFFELQSFLSKGGIDKDCCYFVCNETVFPNKDLNNENIWQILLHCQSLKDRLIAHLMEKD